MQKVPLKYWVAAWLQWISVLIPMSIGVALTYFPMGALVALTSKKQKKHPQGKLLTEKHTDRYIALGSSGQWDYMNSNVSLLKPWNNYEDGTLSEPSGKGSARVSGKERSWWSQYKWLCRNPFNWAKRSSSFFACFVNDCKVEYWGDYYITDKGLLGEGWHFVRATNLITGKVYYGYRKVRNNGDGTVYNAVYGFKLKPSHGDIKQSSDDLDKAFTLRIQFASKPD